MDAVCAVFSRNGAYACRKIEGIPFGRTHVDALRCVSVGRGKDGQTFDDLYRRRGTFGKSYFDIRRNGDMVGISSHRENIKALFLGERFACRIQSFACLSA